jgi:Leucine-rich repeat (LRR) protein
MTISKSISLVVKKANLTSEMLADKIRSKRNLIEINVGTNKLESLPRLVTFAPHSESLKSLNLEFNSISTLPNDIFDMLPNLVFFSVRGNKLQRLPTSLLGLDLLHTLDVA